MKRRLLLHLAFLPFLVQAQLSGPDHPDLTVTSTSQGFDLTISNSVSSNNFNEGYSELDPLIVAPDSINGIPLTQAEKDEYATFYFQGYMIFQTEGQVFNLPDRLDPMKARLVDQSDLDDGVETLTSSLFFPQLGNCAVTIEVDGNDLGVVHNYTITNDAFGTGNFEVGQVYCYTALAYAYNPNKKHPMCVNPTSFLLGSQSPTPVCKAFQDPTSVSEHALLAQDFKAFYQPSFSQISVAFQQAPAGAVRILDITGKTHREIIAEQNLQISTTSWSSGLYLIQYESKTGEMLTKKIFIH